jgi:uncharacterized integral membrane protein
MKTKTVILIVLGGLMVILFVQNTQVITYRLFFWKIAMSQVILVPVIFFAGFFAGYWLAHFGRRRGRRRAGGEETLPPQPAQLSGR